MNIRKRISLVLPLTAVLLTGCVFEKQEIGPIELPPKESGNLNPLASQLYPVDKIKIEYQSGFEVREAFAEFAPKGIIKGMESPMVPLATGGSDLDNLGFVTYISLDGRRATLTYNDDILQFQEGDKSLFINNQPGIIMADAPLFNNSTLYIPILPVLEALDIHHELEGDTLVIGQQYTDDALAGQDIQTTGISTVSPSIDDLEEETVENETEVIEDGQSSTDDLSTGDGGI